MSLNDESNNPSNTVSVKRKIAMDQAIFLTLVLLALIGVGVTDISPSDAHRYWTAMLVVFASAAIYSGWKQASMEGEKRGDLVLKQAIHWGGSLTAILCVYTLLHTGTINYEEAGFVMLLILALATFLAGTHVGWRFYVLGALLALTSVVAAYIEEFMWIIILFAVAIVGATFYWAKHKTKE